VHTAARSGATTLALGDEQACGIKADVLATRSISMADLLEARPNTRGPAPPRPRLTPLDSPRTAAPALSSAHPPCPCSVSKEPGEILPFIAAAAEISTLRSESDRRAEIPRIFLPPGFSGGAVSHPAAPPIVAPPPSMNVAHGAMLEWFIFFQEQFRFHEQRSSPTVLTVMSDEAAATITSEEAPSEVCA